MNERPDSMARTIASVLLLATVVVLLLVFCDWLLRTLSAPEYVAYAVYAVVAVLSFLAGRYRIIDTLMERVEKWM